MTHSLALLTDLYQLTMAYGYWRQGLATDGTESVFHLFFRRAPFKGHYAICAGLESALDYLTGLRFTEDDLAYLAGLRSPSGSLLFDDGFLEYLRGFRFTAAVDAIAEGEVVFPHEPLMRLQGNLVDCQLVETALLNMVNFQTLVATKGARVAAAAGGDPVLEFGLRRAQGVDGALAASRAAYLGGCAATSNVLAGKQFGIPVRGTHAHAWVMVFGDELEAFRAYAAAMPGNCTLLVDTYDTLRGVEHAIEIGLELRSRGHDLAGIRLDSGDLTALSIAARAMLDEAGFHRTAIVASNDLDEAGIAALRAGGSRISIWGVGTRLVTSHDQPALGGVYKLAAIRRPGGPWQDRIKLSNDLIKVSNPGLQGVRRFEGPDGPITDVIYDTRLGCTALPDGQPLPDAPSRDLLVPVLRDGVRVAAPDALATARQRAITSCAHFGITGESLGGRPYPVVLDRTVADQKAALVAHWRTTSAQER
jgi:nicotinate phosphoribosyltransferase